MIAREEITGLVLAGGEGRRMGGIDKGLQLLHGVPLAMHALRRLQPQVGRVLLNANRSLNVYRGWGIPVISDADAYITPSDLHPHGALGESSFHGPLAGFLAGLTHCPTPWLLTAACDTPYFPLDLAQRLGAAALAQQALIAMPIATESEASRAQGMRSQPTFCLMHRSVLPSLREFIETGGRKIDRWTSSLPHILVPFDAAHDHTHAFANINTPEDLQRAELKNN